MIRNFFFSKKIEPPPTTSHMTHNPDVDQCVDPKLDTIIASIQNGGDRKERACDSLVMCILTTLNQGLRNGGGIGDILRAPSSTVSFHFEIFLHFSLIQLNFISLRFIRKVCSWLALYTICCSFSL